MNTHIIDAVGEILRLTAAKAVMPRFKMLQPGESEVKAAGEPVTVADREAEEMIAQGLLDLRPSSRVIGEEACAADPSLLDDLGEDTVWIVDPIDGIANFVDGRTPFAMKVALLKYGEMVGSWILDPLSDRLAVAERGGGAWIMASGSSRQPRHPRCTIFAVSSALRFARPRTLRLSPACVMPSARSYRLRAAPVMNIHWWRRASAISRFIGGP